MAPSLGICHAKENILEARIGKYCEAGNPRQERILPAFRRRRIIPVPQRISSEVHMKPTFPAHVGPACTQDLENCRNLFPSLRRIRKSRRHDFPTKWEVCAWPRLAAAKFPSQCRIKFNRP